MIQRHIQRLTLLTSTFFGFNLMAAPQDALSFMVEKQLIADGKELFARNCAGCHGINADGQGPAASMLNPKPRNLLQGAFKLRSTPLGSLPTTDDLIRTIDQGIKRSSMPSFKFIPQDQKLALAKYIQSLRSDWKENQEATFPIPEAPKEIFSKKQNFLVAAFRGEKLYKEACHTCHGDNGHGKGPNSEGLVDSENQPIQPANLGERYFKSGPTARDVYKAILTGLDGTPMPSFSDVYKPEQIWDLVSYVFFLRGQSHGIYPKDLKLTAESKNPEPSNKKSSSNEEDSWN